MDDSTLPNLPVRTRSQFHLRSLFGFMLLVCVMSVLVRLGWPYFAIGAALTYGMFLVGIFVSSPYQSHVRVVATLVGGILYSASLCLPVIPNLGMRGWQVAGFFAEHTLHLKYSTVLYTNTWDVINIWLIDTGNLIALALTPFVIWKPRRVWVMLTLLLAPCVACAWSCVFVRNELDFSLEHMGYWVWCMALTVLMFARLAPFHWQFQTSELES